MPSGPGFISSGWSISTAQPIKSTNVKRRGSSRSKKAKPFCQAPRRCARRSRARRRGLPAIIRERRVTQSRKNPSHTFESSRVLNARPGGEHVSTCLLRNRRSHELGPDRISDLAGHDPIDFGLRVLVDGEVEHVDERVELLLASRAPERNTDARLIEHPAQRQVNDAL